MAKELNKKQKQLLKKWHDEEAPSKIDKIVYGSLVPKFSASSLTKEQIKELEQAEKTNDTFESAENYLANLDVEDDFG